MTRTTVLALALAAACAAAPAFAGTPIDQTRALAADGSVSITNVAGRITVRTWDQPQVRITGTLGKGVEKLVVEGDARNLHIEAKYPDGRGGWFGHHDVEDTILEVTLPKQASVEAHAVSADVDVQGVFGRRLDIESVSGDVKVSRSAPGQGSFENVSGDLDLWLDTADLDLDNVSGDVKVHGAITGEAELETVSGDLEFAARALRRLSVNTVSGDATLSLALADGGEIDAEAVSGNIDLKLPASTSARLHIESFSGDITSPVGHVEEEDHGPGSSLDARLGGGNGRIKMESLSGDIRVITGADGNADVEK